MLNSMRSKGIEISQNDSLYIDLLNKYILNKKILNKDELRELNQSVITYLVEHPKKNYVDLMKKSKTLKGKVDWEELEKYYQQELTDWDNLLADIDKVEKEI